MTTNNDYYFADWFDDILFAFPSKQERDEWVKVSKDDGDTVRAMTQDKAKELYGVDAVDAAVGIERKYHDEAHSDKCDCPVADFLISELGYYDNELFGAVTKPRPLLRDAYPYYLGHDSEYTIDDHDDELILCKNLDDAQKIVDISKDEDSNSWYHPVTLEHLPFTSKWRNLEDWLTEEDWVTEDERDLDELSRTYSIVRYKSDCNGSDYPKFFKSIDDFKIQLKNDLPFLENEYIPIAVYSVEEHSLTFYTDVVVPAAKGDKYDGKTVTDIFTGFETAHYKEAGEVPWKGYRKDIKSVIFDDSFSDIQPISTAYWFYDFNNCESITGLKNFDTSQVVDMGFMFCNCSSLKLRKFDLFDFYTYSATKMKGMFYGCSDIQVLDLSGWYTRNVTDMSDMFEGCKNLESLDLSGWDTSSVVDIENMFRGCDKLKNTRTVVEISSEA